jgi:hypothetical protein
MSKSMLSHPLALAAAGAATAALVAYIVSRGLGKVAKEAGGLVTGDNALTRGTPYQGAGLPGTVGAATNAATGGVLESLGGWIGGKLYDVFGEDYDPNAPTPPFVRNPARLAEGARRTNELWGPLGQVELRP